MPILHLPATRRGFELVVLAAAITLTGLGLSLTSNLPQPTRELLSSVGLLAGGLVAIVCCWLRSGLCMGRRRRAWRLLAAAGVAAAAGNLVAALTGTPTGSDSPGSATDMGLVAALLLAIIGLLSFPTARRRGAELTRMVLDGLIGGAAVLFITSVLVFPQLLETGSEPAWSHAVALILPLLDVLLATLAVLLVVRSTRRDRVSLGLVGSGFILYAIADLAYAVLTVRDEFSFGSPIDLGWIAGYALVALAASYPDGGVAESENGRSEREEAGTTLVIFVLVVLAAMLQIHTALSGLLSITQGVLWMILLVLVTARQTLLTADNAALRRGLEHRVAEQTADLRQMTRQLEVFRNSVGDGIYGVDRDGRITFINPAGANVLGHSGDQLLGRPAYETFHGMGQDGASRHSYIADAINHGLTASAQEDTYIRADGSAIPVEVTATPLVGDQEIEGAVVVFRDITQRREVDRMKNEFISVVSHELRTPLTAIRGSLGLLASGAMGPLTPATARMTKIAVESCERLTRLINDILDIERIESGALPMVFAEHDARELIEASVAQVQGAATTANVRVVVGDAVGRVRADADRIVQTITNLLGNAIKFSPPGGTVHVSASLQSREVLFRVSDEGRGIPPDKLKTIFRRFEQVDSSDARQKGGTGLGLAISGGIVERHGGRIWAESQPGQGATLLFTLPRCDKDELDDDVLPEAPLVLVCHDDAAVVQALTDMLTRRGYRAVGVTDGNEAVSRAIDERPALVLLDLLTPDASGSQVISQLKAHERSRRIPIVAIPEPRAGTEVWLDKPLDERLISDIVAATIEENSSEVSVLVIEDDDDLARVIVTLLGRHGIAVAHVRTARDALNWCRQHRPDIIVLDLQLPDGHGVEVVSALRREHRLTDTPLVVYSAGDVSHEARQGLQLGHTIFLTKGRVTPEELEDEVLNLVDILTGRRTGEVGVGSARVG
jgi:PAS domain S-box-containing protein